MTNSNQNGLTATENENGVIASRTTFRTLLKKGTIEFLSELRLSNQGRPFVTLTRGNKAVNIWFGKTTAEKLAERNFVKGSSVKDEVVKMDMIEWINPDGEIRMKLVYPGERKNYEGREALLKAAGIDISEVEYVVEQQSDFDIAGFMSLFSAKPAVETVGA